MKYRVYVKEIWERSYVVEANSKAHAKTVVQEKSKTSAKSPTSIRFWGLVGSETWTVEASKS